MRGRKRQCMALAGLLGLAWGGLHAYSRYKLRRLQAEFPPVGEYVTVEGLRLHYVSRGSGRPVVFFHGADGVLQDYSMTVLDRAAAEYRAIAFDRPGHGYSERPPGEVATPLVQARLFHDALRALGVSKPVLVGHSWSGALLLAYALHYPDEVAAIVLLAGVAYSDGARINPIGWLYRLPQVPVLGNLLLSTALVPVGSALARLVIERAFWPDSTQEAPPGYVETLAAFVVRPGQFRANAEDMRVLNRALQALSPEYGRITAPVVIVTGDCDPIVDPKEHAYALHVAIPHSRLITLRHAGHEIPQTRPEAVLRAVRLAWEEAERRQTPRGAARQAGPC